jgi:hypothetical protein
MNCEEKISKCEEINSNPRIVINDPDGGKSELRLKNFKGIKVRIIRVDNCIIKDDTTRCDYVVEIPMDNIKVVLFIELKGKNVEHGIEQLEKTINHICFKDRYNSVLKKRAYLMITQVKIPKSKVENFKEKFRNKYNCLLIIKEHIEVDIEELLNRPSNKD